MPLINGINAFHVHNPRCAGSAINNCLFDNKLLELKSLRPQVLDGANFYGISNIDGQKLELDHLPISQVIARLSIDKIHSTHFFSVVRHPWSRFKSDYYRKKERGDDRFLSAKNCTLEEYLEKFLLKASSKKNLFLKKQFQSAHFWYQTWFADFSQHPDIIKCSVLKFENLHADWNAFQKKLGFSSPLLRKNINASHQSVKEIEDDSRLLHSELYQQFKRFYWCDYQRFEYN